MLTRTSIFSVALACFFSLNTAFAADHCVKVEQDCKFFGRVIIFVGETQAVIRSEKLGWTVSIDKPAKKICIANEKSKRRFESVLAKFSFAPIVSSLGNTDLETRTELWKRSGQDKFLGKDVQLYRSMFNSTYRTEKGSVVERGSYSRPGTIKLMTREPVVGSELTTVINRLFGLPNLPGLCLNCVVGEEGASGRDVIVRTSKISSIGEIPKVKDSRAYLPVKNSEDVLVDSTNEALEIFR